MAGTKESLVKNQIKRLLKKYAAYYHMPFMSGMGSAGVPDFAVGHNGRYLAIEAKAGDNAPTELQWARLREVERAGCSTMVIFESNLHLLDAWLKDSTMVMHVVREMNSRRVLHHWTNKGVM